MNPKQLNRILIIMITVLGVSGLGAYWLSHQTLSTKADELSKVIADISLANHRLTSYEELESEYDTLEPLAEKVDNVLPADKRQTEVTLQLEAIVRRAGLTLSGLTFESTSGRPGEKSQTLAANVPGVLVMPVQFQITSSYEDFLQVLQSIERHERYMQVSDLSISRTGEQLQFNVNLEVFLRP